MKTKVLSYAEPEKFQVLIDHLVNVTADYLIKQIDAGAEAVQIFDSWAGALDPIGFKKWSIEPTKRIVELIHVEHPDVPIIGFPKGAGYNYISYAKETGITALGLDQHVRTDWAARELQSLLPVQGNLDPFVVMAGGDAMRRAVDEIKNNLGGGAYIFNLGHGIHKDTPVAHVGALVEMIREG